MADDGLSRLTDDEKTAWAALLQRTISEDRYPFSPRIRTLTGILAKLEPPKPAGGTYTAAAALRTATHHGKAAAGAALRFTVRADRSG